MNSENERLEQPGSRRALGRNLALQELFVKDWPAPTSYPNKLSPDSLVYESDIFRFFAQFNRPSSADTETEVQKCHTTHLIFFIANMDVIAMRVLARKEWNPWR